MEELIIRGGRPLSGELQPQGAKNSVLPLLAASLLFTKGCVLHNCPRLSDVKAAVRILKALGCEVAWEGHSIRVESRNLCVEEIPEKLMGTMRSSVLFLGPLMARLGRCRLSQPGGCVLGKRPIDLHLNGLKTLGAEITEEDGSITCCGTLKAGTIALSYPSVGATENLILAALGAVGITTIYNAAKEPEIGDLIGFLTAGGAKIYGRGTSMLQVEGGLPQEASYEVMPDRMEAATYLSAVAGCGGEILVRGAVGTYLKPVLSSFVSAGCHLREEETLLHLRAPERLNSIYPVRTGPYPAFPTDAQAPFMAAMLRADGVTVIEENIFADRYRHVPALKALGGDIRTQGAVAVIRGVEHLHGTYLEATDLRGGAAMAVGALQAQGESRLSSVEHILRGYENFSGKLSALGADVETHKR